jgi:hypothetical protein
MLFILLAGREVQTTLQCLCFQQFAAAYHPLNYIPIPWWEVAANASPFCDVVFACMLALCSKSVCCWARVSRACWRAAMGRIPYQCAAATDRHRPAGCGRHRQTAANCCPTLSPHDHPWEMELGPLPTARHTPIVSIDITFCQPRQSLDTYSKFLPRHLIRGSQISP